MRQLHVVLTKKGKIPIKLWLESPSEMRTISNKRSQLAEIFKWLDFRGLGRIDTLELFVVLIVAIEGSTESVLSNLMVFFGFESDTEFSADELHYTLDCFFRGLLNLTILRGQTEPKYRGYSVKESEIVKFVQRVYPGAQLGETNEPQDREFVVESLSKNQDFMDLLGPYQK